MNVRLARPPTAISAPRFAEDVAAWARRRFAVELDFSVASLAAVDDLLARMRASAVALDDRVGETLWALGCYVGEVFVRNADARWHDADVARGIAPVVLACGDTTVNPIGAVVRRVAAGGRDLPGFYTAYVTRR
jgi:hypothetical protein